MSTGPSAPAEGLEQLARGWALCVCNQVSVPEYHCTKGLQYGTYQRVTVYRGVRAHML